MFEIPLDLDVAVARLRDQGRDREADDVIESLAWMLGDEPLHRLNQAAVQQFVWFELPYKWLGGIARQRRVVRSLARFFVVTGLSRYAAVCTDRFTDEQLLAFSSGGARTAFQRFERRHLASGAVPLDVHGFSWGTVMGEREYEAYWQVAMACELSDAATSSGVGTAGSGGSAGTGPRSARQRAIDATSITLSRPQADRFEQSLLDEVELERLSRWIDDGQFGLARTRTQILAGVANQLLSPVETPRGVAGAMAPVRWLLSVLAASGDGLRLTNTGELPRAVVQEGADRFGIRVGWVPANPGRVPQRSAQVRGIPVLVDLGLRAGVWSVRSKTLVARPAMAARFPAIAAGFVPKGGFDHVAWPLFLALALEGNWSPADTQRIVGVAMSEIGRFGRVGVPIEPDQVSESRERLLVAARVVGAIDLRGREPRLTDTGRCLARAALRALATAPAER